MNLHAPPPKKDDDEISQLKRQVADLRKSEAFFRAVAQNSSDIVIVVNKKAKILYVNPAVERHLGYRADELIGKSGFAFIVPSDIPRALVDFGKALLTRKTPVSNSFSILHRNGSVRILEGTGVNLLHDPIVKGFVMNVQDVTDRRRTESELESYRQNLEALVDRRTTDISRINTRLVRELNERKVMEKAVRESEKKYRDFLDSAPIGVGIIDLRGNVVYINKRIEEFMGWSPEDIIGKNGFGLESFDDETRARLCERFAARVGGDENRLMEIPIIRRNKPLLWVQVITTILKKDDVPVGAQVIFVDITARKEAEEALRQSEDRFRTLIQRSSDVITILDAQGLVIYNSPSAETIFGYASETMQGRSFLDFIHPDDHEIVVGRLAGLVNNTRSGSTSEFRAQRGDATWRTFETSGKNLLEYPGINGVVFMTRDITERKKVEEERRILTEKLHRAEKLESLGTLAGGVAHDLNNVIGALVGYTQLMLAQTRKESPLRKNLNNIMKSSEKGSAIIQDLLTLARRGVNSAAEVIDLGAVLTDFFLAPEFERIQAYHPHVTFRKVLAVNLLNMKGMPVHLSKMLMNIVSNAAEAICGAGEVTISTANIYLSGPINGYAEVREGDYIVLTVADTGEGISEADIGKIFEPFYTKKVMGRSGTGLGLAVVWGTVKDHAGYIDVQSEPGYGSTFRIYFPATRDAVQRTSEISISPASYSGSGESILIVDDIHEQREVAANLLAGLGYRVSTVASGEDAVEYMTAKTVDVIILDMLMEPGIDGLETYRRIRQIHPCQKALIVSGFSETDRVKEAIMLGVGAYIQKPYRVEKIGMALRKVLSESRQQ